MTIFNEPTFWCAAVSSSCAAYTVFSNEANRRKQLLISLNWIGFPDFSQADVSFTIYNPSSVNRAITGVEIFYNDKFFPVTSGPDILMSKTIENGSSMRSFSGTIPANISPKYSNSLILSFKNLSSEMISPNNLSFVFTIDGKKRTYHFSITERLLDKDQLAQRLTQLLE